MILLLNNDTEIITPNWIEEMLMYAQFDEVGIVGAKLYYPNGALQHVGVGVGLMGVSAHYFMGYPKDFHGYFGRINCTQDLGAVTGACLMVSRKKFDEVGGLDEGLAVAYNDIDYCLKILTKGYKVVFTPYAELYHAESLTRGYSDATFESSMIELNEKKRFLLAWGKFIEKGDPYYNKNLPHTFDMKQPK